MLLTIEHFSDHAVLSWLTDNRGVVSIAIHNDRYDHNKSHYDNADNYPRIRVRTRCGGGVCIIRGC